MMENLHENENLLNTRENIDIDLNITEKILNEGSKETFLSAFTDNDIKEMNIMLNYIDNDDIKDFDIEWAKKELEDFWFTAEDIEEIENYLIELKSNPEKLKKDFNSKRSNKIFVIAWFLLLEYCYETADSPEKMLKNLFKELKKKNLEYSWELDVNWMNCKDNKIWALETYDENIEIYVKYKYKEAGELRYTQVYGCLIYNEDTGVFTKKDLIKNREKKLTNDEAKTAIIEIQRRKDAIKKAIDKDQEDDDNENVFRHEFKRRRRRKKRERFW